MSFEGGRLGPPDGGAMGQPTPATRAAQTAAVAQVAADLAALNGLTGAELAERYVNLFGSPARSRNKAYLRKRLAWRIQELAEGGLSRRALARIEQLASEYPAPWQRRDPPPASNRAPAPGAPRDPRLPPPGTVLSRPHGGVEHKVTVLDDGFEYRGERYRSLSKIARVISGTPWNGFTFFFGRAQGTRKDPKA